MVTACQFYIKKTWHIRLYLSEEAAKRIMLAAVTCQFNHGTTQLVNFPKYSQQEYKKSPKRGCTGDLCCPPFNKNSRHRILA